MFEPKENPAYEKLCRDAAGLIARWTRNDWYDGSADEPARVDNGDDIHSTGQRP